MTLQSTPRATGANRRDQMIKLIYSNERDGATRGAVIGNAKTWREAAGIARRYLGRGARREHICPGTTDRHWVRGIAAFHAEEN